MPYKDRNPNFARQLIFTFLHRLQTLQCGYEDIPCLIIYLGVLSNNYLR